MLLGYWTEEIDKALNKTRTQRLINPILHLSQFTPSLDANEGVPVTI